MQAFKNLTISVARLSIKHSMFSQKSIPEGRPGSTLIQLPKGSHQSLQRWAALRETVHKRASVLDQWFEIKYHQWKGFANSRKGKLTAIRLGNEYAGNYRVALPPNPREPIKRRNDG